MRTLLLSLALLGTYVECRTGRALEPTCAGIHIRVRWSSAERIPAGESVPLYAVRFDATEHRRACTTVALDAAQVEWRSSDERVVRVDADGTARALQPGSAVVMARMPSTGEAGRLAVSVVAAAPATSAGRDWR